MQMPLSSIGTDKQRLLKLGEERRRQQAARKKGNQQASTGQSTNPADPSKGSPGLTAATLDAPPPLHNDRVEAFTR
jgi:hypothetical protein